MVPMKNLSVLAVLAVVALGTSGCSDPTATPTDTRPLVGRWNTTISPEANTTYNLAMTLGADDTVVFALTGGGTCAGSLTYTGPGWSSSATVLTLTGTGQCAGAGLTCTGRTGTPTCSDTGPGAGTCNYQLTNNNATLVLSGCTSPNQALNATYTRGS